MDLTLTDLDAIANSPAITATGLAPGYVPSDDEITRLIRWAAGVDALAVWLVADLGYLRREKLRKSLSGRDYYDAVGTLYAEMSEYYPTVSVATWPNYLNVAGAVPHARRVAGCGPSRYVPLLSFSPEVIDHYIDRINDGMSYRLLLSELYPEKSGGRSMSPQNGSVPYSGSGHNRGEDVPEHVAEYEDGFDDDTTDGEMADEVFVHSPLFTALSDAIYSGDVVSAKAILKGIPIQMTTSDVVDRVCQWGYDDGDDGGYWSTSCGMAFVLTDGTPAENDFFYCPKCGKEIGGAA